jgi:hypothetical protein
MLVVPYPCRSRGVGRGDFRFWWGSLFTLPLPCRHNTTNHLHTTTPPQSSASNETLSKEISCQPRVLACLAAVNVSPSSTILQRLTVDEEMIEDLAIIIDSSGGKAYNAALSPTLSSYSEDDPSTFGKAIRPPTVSATTWINSPASMEGESF